jgi:leader peptidase (prepilin peptidase)/N-methyltransferase
VVFLLPVIVGVLVGFIVLCRIEAVRPWWVDTMQSPVLAGFLGSLWGYLAGCAVVWATRILGTLAFGKEAMGLGDVHLMGAAGAVTGPLAVVLAFFIAPFFGLAWAMYQAIFKKTRQIPYGPFLSMAVFVVMIFHDWFGAWIAGLYFYQ